MLNPKLYTLSQCARWCLQWSPGEPMLIFSAQEMDALMDAHPKRVIVLEASFTWCRPCKAFQRPYEVLISYDCLPA